MDIVTIKKTGTNYRVNFDVKGRWRLVKISKEDAIEIMQSHQKLYGTKENSFYYYCRW